MCFWPGVTEKWPVSFPVHPVRKHHQLHHLVISSKRGETSICTLNYCLLYVMGLGLFLMLKQRDHQEFLCKKRSQLALLLHLSRKCIQQEKCLNGNLLKILVLLPQNYLSKTIDLSSLETVKPQRNSSSSTESSPWRAKIPGNQSFQDASCIWHTVGSLFKPPDRLLMSYAISHALQSKEYTCQC